MNEPKAKTQSRLIFFTVLYSYDVYKGRNVALIRKNYNVPKTNPKRNGSS